MDKTRHGSCLCRKVTYTTTGEPLVCVVCHCMNCQKASGSAFKALALIKKSQVEIYDPENQLKDYRDGDTGSGRTITRTFCSTCGSSIFIHLARLTQMMYVATGTIDDLDSIAEWKPEMEGYCQDARTWFGGVEDSVRYEKLFDYPGRFPELFAEAATISST